MIPYKKPFLVTGEYDPPLDLGDTRFCRFLDIKPYVFGAVGKILCSHIHVTRKLAERWYDRFTIDLKGKEFVLCVKPYVYEGSRGGLELTGELNEWIEPIFPASWYSGPLEVLSKIPEGKILDFRFVPKRMHYLSDITSYQRISERTKAAKPKDKKKKKQRKLTPYQPVPDMNFVPEEGRPSLQQIEKEITRITGMSKTRSGKLILATQGVFFDSASSKLDWLLKELDPWIWTEWEVMHFLKRIDVTPEKFTKLKRKSFRVWYEEKFGPSWLL